MRGFSLQDRELYCDGVSLAAIAAAEGTPLYVYSAATIRDRYCALDRAFGNYPHAIHFALKANSTLGIARVLKQEGSAVDANSIWEIEVARRAGFDPSQIVFTGVGKSPEELARAVPMGLKFIIVESAGELDRIEAIANTDRPVHIAVRVNPDIDAESHPHISTGLSINKFGVPAAAVKDLLLSCARRPRLKLVAIHVHIGSQVTSAGPVQRAARFAAEFAESLRSAEVTLDAIDMGGGLGISYDEGPVLSADDYVATLLKEIRPTDLSIAIEPGRSIVGPAGVLVARVIDLKEAPDAAQFAVLDAGMTELIRPALYGAFHRISAVKPRTGPSQTYDIVGPVCESSDVLGTRRTMPTLEVGDLVAVHDAGAYGSTMASNYNRRPLPAEVLVDEGRVHVMRRRQTVDDLLAQET